MRTSFSEIRSRSQLLKLLSEACELEHGLACSYLYAAFSLKQELIEGGMTWQQLQHARRWASLIYLIAAQEMLHLAQAWNLLAAIGGSPYYYRPNFPQDSKYYPLQLPLEAAGFSLGTLDRFIQFERPSDLAPAVTKDGPDFHSVGQLYGLIASGFQNIPEEVLFVGFEDRQVGTDLVDFPDLVKVTNRKSALTAIELVTHQGEGIRADREDCHFGIFRSIRRSYIEQMAEAEKDGQVFDPVRACIANPAASDDPAVKGFRANLITDPFSASVASCSDSTYSLMLRMLQWVFDSATSDPALLRSFSRCALRAMATVIKPLGEALMLLPAGPGYEDQTAGPPFGLTRHVPLPIECRAATAVVLERFEELVSDLNSLAKRRPDLGQLLNAARTLRELKDGFERESSKPEQASKFHDL